MTHGKVTYFDFTVIDAILVCLNFSEITTRAFTTILLPSFALTFLDRTLRWSLEVGISLSLGDHDQSCRGFGPAALLVQQYVCSLCRSGHPL